MAKFDLSIGYVLDNEGDQYSVDPIPTKFGITNIDVAEILGVPVNDITEKIMHDLQLVGAQEIYQKLYWDKMRLNDLDDQNIATCVFDTGVNRGIRIGAIYAQQTCSWYNRPIDLDGIIGPLTIKAINSMSRYLFIEHYQQLEWAGYQAILDHHPKNEIYRAGWEARSKRLLTLR